MRHVSILLMSLGCIAVTASGQVVVPRGLRVLPPVRIQETDTLFLSRPTQMVLGPRGHLYLTEGREARVLDIGPTGKIERVFGRQGRGPGEFVTPMSMTMSGDTLLAVYDHSVKRVTLIDVATWTLRGVIPLIAQGHPVLRYSNGDLLVTNWDFETKTSLAVAAPETGALGERQGVIPSLGAQTQTIITGAFWNGTFAPLGDEIFAMFEVSNSLFTWKRGTTEAREIALPVLRRRGIPPGFFESLFRDPARATPAMIYDRSAPVVLAPLLSDDLLGIVTMDVKVDAEQWYGVHHLTLFDRRRNRVCVDLEIPASRMKVAFARDPLPVVALRADTLALLELTADQAGDPVQVVRRYQIEPSRCTWSAITR